MSQTFLALTDSKADLEWLQTSLSSLGQVLHVDDSSLDSILALIGVTGATILFIGLSREQLAAQSALIEDCMEARPMLSVVGLGDGLDTQLVLSAMRAGARDFIAYGSRSSEVAGLVRRLGKRLPNVVPVGDCAGISVLYCSQADPDAALIASHIALAIQAQGSNTLFIDLGNPVAEAMAILSVESSFNFHDALRNMRRIDASLVSSAFAKHAGGMHLLSLSTDDGLSTMSAAELYLLMGALRQHFQQIVINLAGQADCEALRVVMAQANQVLWYTDQSVPNCRRSLNQLSTWRNHAVALNNCQLLIDRYWRSVTPDAKALTRSYDLPLLDALVANPEVRLNAKNQGRSLFDVAPRDRLSQSLSKIATQLCQPTVEKSSKFNLRFWERR